MLWLSASGFAAGGAGPNIEMDCPCTFAAASASSAVVELGVINRGTSYSGDLKVRAYAHAERDYLASQASRQYMGDISVPSVAPLTTRPAQDYQGSLRLPAPGDYYVTLLLLNDQNYVIDETTMAEPVEITSQPAQVYTAMYFPDEPALEVSNNALILDFPGLVNDTGSVQPVEVFLALTNSPDFFSVGHYRVGEYTTSALLPSGASLPAESSVVFDYTPIEGFEYLHLVVTNGRYVLLLQTLQTPDGVVSGPTFSVQNLNFLKDSDADGVADENERLMGTNPLSAGSRIPASEVDVLVLYDDDIEAGYAEARLDHLFAVANFALADSGVAMTLRRVATRPLAMNNTQPIDGQFGWLDDSESGRDIYQALDQWREQEGADLVTMFRKYDGGEICGLASMGGYATQGILSRTAFLSANFIEFDQCGDTTMIHEIGHNLGLGHSYEQDETGTFVWSRGYGEQGRFATLMAYADAFGVPTELGYFSNPDLVECQGDPCGRSQQQERPADAAASLNAVRYQAENFLLRDVDNDGFPDARDAFPEDGQEWVDTDGDGVGNNADEDDDGDGLPDSFEIQYGLLRLVDDSTKDLDSDGISNIDEYLAQSDPSVHYCEDMLEVRPESVDSTLAHERHIAMVNPASNATRQSFLRFINRNATAMQVEVYGRDDTAKPSRTGPVRFSIPAGAAKQMTVQDLERGNAKKALDGFLCSGAGKWQLQARSDYPLDVMNFIRTTDGFLTGMNAKVRQAQNSWSVGYFNSAANTELGSFLRLVNRTADSGTVRLTGVDDAGYPAEAAITLSLAANEAIQLNARDLEEGNQTKGLVGAFGEGAGLWRIEVESDLSLDVLSLVRMPDGFLVNMSAVVEPAVTGTNRRVVQFFNGAGYSSQESLLRVTNRATTENRITVSGTDDQGQASQPVYLQIPAGQSLLLSATELELGSSQAAVTGSLGDGYGRWRLSLSGAAEFDVVSLLTNEAGLVSNMSDYKLTSAGLSTLMVMNPGSNLNQRSYLRLVNQSSLDNTVSIVGVDDQGNESGVASVTLAPLEAREISATALEEGNVDVGIDGALGDGQGKWRLTVSSERPLAIIHLLQSPSGFMANLTRAVAE